MSHFEATARQKGLFDAHMTPDHCYVSRDMERSISSPANIREILTARHEVQFRLPAHVAPLRLAFLAPIAPGVFQKPEPEDNDHYRANANEDHYRPPCACTRDDSCFMSLTPGGQLADMPLSDNTALTSAISSICDGSRIPHSDNGKRRQHMHDIQVDAVEPATARVHRLMQWASVRTTR